LNIEDVWCNIVMYCWLYQQKTLNKQKGYLLQGEYKSIACFFFVPLYVLGSIHVFLTEKKMDDDVQTYSVMLLLIVDFVSHYATFWAYRYLPRGQNVA
jgi:hypothetical protein